MMQIRRSGERGHFDHGWLNTYHTFSFADYYDPQFMGFRTLRVMNEDRVQAGAGFGTHGHRDMEVISYVLEGALEHRDSLGNGSVLRPGMFQRMTAGTGVEHSEFNGSQTEPVHFYQIWIRPERAGLAPGYEEKRFSDDEKHNRLRLVASRDGREGSLVVHQDVEIRLGVLEEEHEIAYPLREGRHAWVQVLRGRVELDGETLAAGDGAAISESAGLTIRGLDEAEIMVFDLG